MFGKAIQVVRNPADVAIDWKYEDELHILKLAVEQSFDGIIITDLQGKIVYANPASEAMYGYEPGELTGQHVRNLNVETDVSDTRIIPSVKSIGRWKGELNQKRRDGMHFSAHLSASLIEKDGRQLAMLGILRDVTENKQAEKALRESAEKYRNLVEKLDDIIWATDLDLKTVYASPALIKKLGYTPEERIKQDLASQMTPSSYNRAVDLLSKELEREEAGGADPNRTVRLEIEYYHKNGSTRWFENSVGWRRDAQGAIIGLQGVSRDITDRKQAEEAIRESEEKFRNFSEQSFVGFYIIQNGVFQYVNPKFADIFGYTVDECLNDMHFSRLVHPEDLAMVEEQVRKRLTGETKAVQYSFRGIRRTGEAIHVSIYGSALNYKAKPAVIGTMLDLTKELELEKRVAQSQRMEAIGKLAGGIAHDFNNILTPIIGLAEILLENLAPVHPEYENAQEIFCAGKRGSELVKQILAFSRQSEHKKFPVRVQHVLKEVLKLTRSTIPADIEISQNIQSDCNMVMADPTQLHQIAMNLITNAYHAVEQGGGKISISLNETTLNGKESLDRFVEPGRYVMLSIADTGCGIDPRVIGKIFEPYVTTKARGRGTGLGLSVVYGIIKDHKGYIEISSEPGIGSRFVVYLPVIENIIGESSVENSQVVPTGRESILLVDDEKAIVRLEKQILERLGYKVTSRVSSLEALEAFKANPDDYDLLLTDMTMPNMTGDQLARAVKLIRPEVPIIICTGFSERMNREKAIALGINGFLMKPIIRSQMAQIIRKVLDKTG